MISVLGLLFAAFAQEPPPVVTDDRLVLEMVAREPDINTPTGMTVDAKGRVWAIESNTHFPPKGYKGKPTDRILVFEDFASDGHARTIKTFLDGFRYAMGIIHGRDGTVYLATRWDITAIENKEGVAGEKKVIAKLDTKGNYPHNGLSGFTWDHDGWLIFGLGENLGAEYKLVGSDGTTLSGGGEGGNVYRMRPDGSKLQRIATGFWNPFHQCVDVYGRLFIVDNDPDSRPPCRLVHVVQGGDYGFKFRNGRKGLHPFTAWNGELPGTLPMVSDTGEAPVGVLAYEADAFPPEYRGTLLATSWGDHLIERYRLTPKGASFTSKPETIVKGGEHFRPVGIGLAPDGSIFFTDWVDKSYELHGKGKLWRLRAKTPGTTPVPTNAPKDTPALLRMNDVLRITSKEALPALIPLLADPDPFLVSAAIETLSRIGGAPALLPHVGDPNARIRLGVLCALRRTPDVSAVGTFLEDPDLAIRRAAIQWVGEDRLKEHASAMERAAARKPVTRDIFEAYLASSDFLAGVSPTQVDQVGSDLLLSKVLDDERQPASLRALSLRMLRKDHPAASLARLQNLFESQDAELRLEATKALVARSEEGAQVLLRKAVADPALRWEAIAGLSHSVGTSAETRKILLEAEPSLEVLRSMIGANDQPDIKQRLQELSSRSGDLGEKASLILTPRTQDPDWVKIGLEPGDAAAGERLFFHPKGPQCFMCHRVDGRGGIVGPDLTTIGNTAQRAKIIESILEPSKEIAPTFVYWKIRKKNEDIVDGRILYEDPSPTGHVILINAQGLQTKVENKDVDERVASPISIMPEKLVATLTRKEFRDLVSFLASLK
jgi:putative membrane-bound dehydrogenase-like protein